MKNKKVSVVIPARMAASRFPGKPLADILGLPMIEHVRRRVLLSGSVDSVYVATCDEEIRKSIVSFGGEVVMTAAAHERCTERVEEAARRIDAGIFVIVQGDEPLFVPDIIESLIEPILAGGVYCANLLSTIKSKEGLESPDIVKAVTDVKDNIIYFSRTAIPYFRTNDKCRMLRQTGISAFTKEFLVQYTSLKPTPMEKAESVDFLRILEHGYDIRAVITDKEMFGVDRADDVKVVEDILNNDPMQKEYFKRIKSL